MNSRSTDPREVEADTLWQRLSGDRLVVPASLLLAATTGPASRLPLASRWPAPAFIDPDGRPWSFRPLVALDEDTGDRPADGELWLIEGRDGYHTLDEQRLSSWLDDGRPARPALVARGADHGWFRGSGGRPPTGWLRACITTRSNRSCGERRFPLLAFHDGEVELQDMEGGFDSIGFTVPSDRPNAAGSASRPLTASAVRRAIGPSLHRLRCRDAAVDAREIRVTAGSALGAFEVDFELIGDVRRDLRFKRVTARWSPALGDPHAWFVAHVETLELLPGSEEYWP